MFGAKLNFVLPDRPYKVQRLTNKMNCAPNRFISADIQATLKLLCVIMSPGVHRHLFCYMLQFRCGTMRRRLSLKRVSKKTKKKSRKELMENKCYLHKLSSCPALRRLDTTTRILGSRKLPTVIWLQRPYISVGLVYTEVTFLVVCNLMGSVISILTIPSGRARLQVFRSLHNRSAWCLIAQGVVDNNCFLDPSRIIYLGWKTCYRSFLPLGVWLQTLSFGRPLLRRHILFFHSSAVSWVVIWMQTLLLCCRRTL